MTGVQTCALPIFEITDSGFTVTGYDVDAGKISLIESAAIDSSMVSGNRLRSALSSGRLKATSDAADLEGARVFLICVPTPLTDNQSPELSHLESAIDIVGQNIDQGSLIILESTAYPGCTRELLQVRLEDMTGLVTGRDIAVAFSPERVDPGNTIFTLWSVPKLVSGITKRCRRLAASFYSNFIDEVVEVSSPEVAEMAKLLENIYRSVNIALVNEMALICDRMDIDIWQVIEAASTKPFGFTAFYPGPGLGGHCIPVDPFYLSWKAREFGVATEFIELAGRVNQRMPHFVMEKITEALNLERKSVKGSVVLLLGVSYKADVSDLRASPAITIMELLRRRGADVCYHDPHVSILEAGSHIDKSIALTKENLKAADCIVVLAAHEAINWDMLELVDCHIVDTRNVIGRSSKVLTI